MTMKLEEARALGFNSIQECEEHQLWVKKRDILNKQAIEAIKKAESENSNIINLLHINSAINK